MKKPMSKIEKIKSLKMIFTGIPKKETKLKKHHKKREIKKDKFVYKNSPKLKKVLVNLSNELKPKASQSEWEDKRRAFYKNQMNKNRSIK